MEINYRLGRTAGRSLGLLMAFVAGAMVLVPWIDRGNVPENPRAVWLMLASAFIIFIVAGVGGYLHSRLHRRVLLFDEDRLIVFRDYPGLSPRDVRRIPRDAVRFLMLRPPSADIPGRGRSLPRLRLGLAGQRDIDPFDGGLFSLQAHTWEEMRWLAATLAAWAGREPTPPWPEEIAVINPYDREYAAAARLMASPPEPPLEADAVLVSVGEEDIGLATALITAFGAVMALAFLSMAWTWWSARGLGEVSDGLCFFAVLAGLIAVLCGWIRVSLTCYHVDRGWLVVEKEQLRFRRGGRLGWGRGTLRTLRRREIRDVSVTLPETWRDEPDGVMAVTSRDVVIHLVDGTRLSLRRALRPTMVLTGAMAEWLREHIRTWAASTESGQAPSPLP